MTILLLLFLSFNRYSIAQADLIGVLISLPAFVVGDIFFLGTPIGCGDRRQQEANRMSEFVERDSIADKIMQRSMYKNNPGFADFINKKIKETK